MAATVTVDGQSHLKRSPLRVLGWSIIMLGICRQYWYYQVTVEIRRFETDDTVRPGVALLAVSLGWLLIVPPLVSVYNTSLHTWRRCRTATTFRGASPRRPMFCSCS
jgi:hypothetical protein